MCCVQSLTTLADSVTVQAAEVEIEDVSRAYTLFIDVKRSTEFLVAHESDYMFNQVRKCAAACMLLRRRTQTLDACASLTTIICIDAWTTRCLCLRLPFLRKCLCQGCMPPAGP